VARTPARITTAVAGVTRKLVSVDEPAGLTALPGPGRHPVALSVSDQADLHELCDQELLSCCKTLPRGSAQRSAARAELARRYDSLVRACMWHYSGCLEPVEDLMQVGYAGLLVEAQMVRLACHEPRRPATPG
jgi:hypothetical protein